MFDFLLSQWVRGNEVKLPICSLIVFINKKIKKIKIIHWEAMRNAGETRGSRTIQDRERNTVRTIHTVQTD